MRNKFLDIGEPGYHPLRKLRTVIAGLRYAVVHDFSVGYKLVLSVIVLLIAFALRQWVDVLLILLATGLVLTAEVLNTAVEAICDFIEPKHNEKIKIIKDVAAAGVGISILVWAVILAVELSRLWFVIET
jgi:diacylglycerol kinase